jgi:hypothetical protein
VVHDCMVKGEAAALPCNDSTPGQIPICPVGTNNSDIQHESMILSNTYAVMEIFARALRRVAPAWSFSSLADDADLRGEVSVQGRIWVMISMPALRSHFSALRMAWLLTPARRGRTTMPEPGLRGDASNLMSITAHRVRLMASSRLLCGRARGRGWGTAQGFKVERRGF